MGLRGFLVTALLPALVAPAAKALEGDIPYLGSHSLDCKVNVPSGFRSIDAGFLTDESCTTIYVFPPIIGDIQLSPPAFLDTMYCPLINDTVGKITEENKRAEQIGDLSEKSAYFKKVAELRKSMHEIGKGEAFSVFSFVATLNWEELLRAYRKANPQMKDVRKLPVVAGFLNASTTNADVQLDEGKSPLLNLKIFAPGLKEDGGGFEATTNDIVKKITGALDMKGSYIFGQAAAGQMSLRLVGTCGLFNEGGGYRTDPLSYFAGTYTYFYPVQTKSTYAIKLDKLKFEESILQIVKAQNGSITSAQIEDALKKVPSVSVIKKDGIGGEGDSDALEEEYKSQMMQLVANSVVSTIAYRITEGVDKSKYTETTQHTQRSCNNFLFIRSCSTRTYYVSVTKIDWAAAERNLKDLLGDDDPKVAKYRTVYLYSTSAFANVNTTN